MYATTRGCASTTRQSSASHWLSSTTQLTWFFGGGPLVSQRSGFDVGKRTCAVEPDGLYGSSSALIGRCPLKRRGDAGRDPVAGHVGQILVQQQRRVRAALADEARVEPLLRDPLQLTEQVQLRLLAGVAPLLVEQALRQVEEQRRGPNVLEVFDRHVCRFADDALVARVRRTDEIRRQLQHRVGVEGGREPLGRQLDAIALDAREANLQMVPVRPNRLHLHGLPRRAWRRDDRLGGEVERHAEDVGVLGVEQIVFVEVVGLTAERAADHLFAEQLRAERADAEDVGDVVGVPALR